RETALSQVACGDTLIGIQGKSRCNSVKAATSGCLFGNAIHRVGGRGTSCSSGTRHTAAQKRRAHRGLCSWRRRRRRSSEIKSRGIASNCKTASDNKPVIVPPPKSRHETMTPLHRRNNPSLSTGLRSIAADYAELRGHGLVGFLFR